MKLAGRVMVAVIALVVGEGLFGGGLMGQALNDGEDLSHGGRLSRLCVAGPDLRGREEQEVRAVADGAAVLQDALDGDAQFVRRSHGLLFLPCDPDGPQEFGIVDGRDWSALRRRGWLQSPAAAQAETFALALADRELHGITLTAWAGEGSGDPFAADGNMEASHASDSTTSAPPEAPAPPRFLPSAWYLIDLDARRLQEGADVGTVVRMLTLRSHVRGYEHVMGPMLGVRSMGFGWIWRSRDGSFFLGAGAVVETASLFDPDRPLEVRPAVTISMRRGDER